MSGPDRIAVTFLFSRACPSHEDGLRALREAAATAGVALDLDVVEVTSDEQARERAFVGSPTYLIAGRDPFAPAAPGHAPVFDACRPYARPDGRIAPLPHPDDLARALRAAAGRRTAA